MSATNILVFDKKNKQYDYQFMAKGINEDYHIGYVYVDKPWYSDESNWVYYIIEQKYHGSYGASYEERIEVYKDTIIPFSQKAEVLYNQSVGMDTVLEKKFDLFDDKKNNQVAFIKHNDKIPNKLWDDN